MLKYHYFVFVVLNLNCKRYLRAFKIHTCWERRYWQYEQLQQIQKPLCKWKKSVSKLHIARLFLVALSQWQRHKDRKIDEWSPGIWRAWLLQDCREKFPCDDGCRNTCVMNFIKLYIILREKSLVRYVSELTALFLGQLPSFENAPRLCKVTMEKVRWRAHRNFLIAFCIFWVKLFQIKAFLEGVKKKREKCPCQSLTLGL